MSLKTIYKLSAAFAFLLSAAAGCSDKAPSPYTGKGDLELLIVPGTFTGDGTQEPVFFARGTSSGRYTEIWKAGTGGNGMVLFAEPHFYPGDNSRVYLRGFAPEGKSFADGHILYTIDGKQDLIISDEQNGCLTDMFWQEQKTFRFAHLLSQLRFRVCGDKEALEKGWELVELYVDGLQPEVSLSLADKTLTFLGDKEKIAFPVEPAPLEEAWAALPGKVMIQPGVRIHLTAVVADSTGEQTRMEYLPVRFDAGEGVPEAGTSYLISVKLHGGATGQLSAGIAEWVPGNNGSGVI